jgi:hypothetical protein
VSMFQKATKAQAKMRVMLEGASGSGKTTAALTLAAQFGKVAVIDTERGSASLYASQFNFDVLNLEAPYEPERFVEAIQAAEAAGYDCIVIDSITHEWSGPGGCLEIQNKLGGRYQDWGKVTPRHDKFVQSILGSKCHVITTCRAKQAYSMDEKTRKVEKLGMEPQQRDGLDFEMTLVFHMNQQHIATATKDRTKLFDGRDCSITKDTAEKIKAWLADGVPAVEAPIDYKAKCRELYAKLGADVAGPIVKANGEDWKKSYGEMLAAGGQTNG